MKQYTITADVILRARHTFTINAYNDDIMNEKVEQYTSDLLEHNMINEDYDIVEVEDVKNWSVSEYECNRDKNRY